MRLICTKTYIRAALALAAVPTAAHAITMSEFVANRIERFGALKAANPQQPAQIEQIRQRTAVIVAALPPVSQKSLGSPSVVWRTIDTPVVIFDDPVAPRMVVVPAGEFTMGAADKSARHRVRIDHALAVGMFPIVVGEFALFVEATGYKAAASCVTFEDGAFKQRSGARLAQSASVGDAARSRDVRFVDRCDRLCHLAIEQDGPEIPPAVRGRVRICQPRRDRRRLLVGR